MICYDAKKQIYELIAVLPQKHYKATPRKHTEIKNVRKLT